MRVDDELLKRLEKLGMITIQEDKKEKIKEQISEVLGFVDNLASVDVSHIQPQSHLKAPLREDVPRDSQMRESILEDAPKTKDGFFVVPKIIE